MYYCLLSGFCFFSYRNGTKSEVKLPHITEKSQCPFPNVEESSSLLLFEGLSQTAEKSSYCKKKMNRSDFLNRNL